MFFSCSSLWGAGDQPCHLLARQGTSLNGGLRACGFSGLCTFSEWWRCASVLVSRPSECMTHIWVGDESNRRLITQKTRISKVTKYARESLRRRFFAIHLYPKWQGIRVSSWGSCVLRNVHWRKNRPPWSHASDLRILAISEWQRRRESLALEYRGLHSSWVLIPVLVWSLSG